MSPYADMYNVANAIIPGSVKFYWGRIHRDDAEKILLTKGNGVYQEGMYLLRESSSKFGNYAVSLSHESRVHHYSIERDDDGMVWIPGGKKFIGPVELVRYHAEFIAGFLTRPTTPCNRGPGEIPMVFRGVPMYEIEQKVIELLKAQNVRGIDLEYALGRDRAKYFSMVAQQLHLEQPWFHGVIDRQEAERRMHKAGHQNGKFLVRQRQSKSYALTLSHQAQCVHYLIDLSQNSHYSIESGTRFGSLMEELTQKLATYPMVIPALGLNHLGGLGTAGRGVLKLKMIDTFHSRSEGLRCKLLAPCHRPDFIAGPNGFLCPSWRDEMKYGEIYNQNIPGANLRLATEEGIDYNPPRPPVRDLGGVDVGSVWDEPDVPPDPPPAVPTSKRPSVSKLDKLDGMYDEKVYDTVPRNEEMMKLPREHLDLREELGSGQFGSVLKGIYKMKGKKHIPVAVKTLKKTDDTCDASKQAENDIMKEAKVMQGLSHKHVVRMIGVCKAETIMLVMELAPYGQLNKYLKKHLETPKHDLLELAHQIAKGMKYLEAGGFVHRDLAARNVLLASPQLAKISDFGMSRALNFGSEYYKPETVGKWPLKWYAPECIYYYKFDSRSDVWSYGVTVWEMFSYGGKPYKGMKGNEILTMIESGQRLLKPDGCPASVYGLMRKCWSYEKDKRPKFDEVEAQIRDLAKTGKPSPKEPRGGGAWGGRV